MTTTVVLSEETDQFVRRAAGRPPDPPIQVEEVSRRTPADPAALISAAAIKAVALSH
ncbi:hypothetical protein ACFY0B_08535 [Streptomyces sp. NPDC001797]|uniref:hypothetical protein n=1 Tax=Streptomyces sp. NPDC001797 TaxID=3364610 RepID=UPI00369F6C61